MSRYVEVENGDEKLSVRYEPNSLMAAPLWAARKAIEQEELLWLLDHKKFDVKQQLGVVFRNRWFGSDTLDEYPELRLSENPEFDSPGVVVWHFELPCPECDGAGETTTAKGRDIACPCCGATGATHKFHVFTNGDGRFIGFAPIPITRPVISDFDEYDFEPWPLEDALEAVAEFFS